MRLSRRYPAPSEFALLYEFANSLDLRRFVQDGAPHAGGDELATAPQLEMWMRRRGLLDHGASLEGESHRKALDLRNALRAFLQLAPVERRRDAHAAALLNDSAAHFPLIVRATNAGTIELHPAPGFGASGLARVLAELQLAAATARLDRLKMCGSEECRWVFFDRSKPGTRRWCSSTLCGNRQKTRTYRRRRKEARTPERDAR
jgi:predicted RNA-binding Zn ribbon-like protein